jgi:hypothetical protein
MRKLAALMLPLFSCAPAIDSVDGLGGGELSSALSAPKITTDNIEARTATLGDVSAAAVDADGVTTRSVDADTIRHRGFVLAGAPLGKVQFGELAEPAGYRSADDTCRGAFGVDAHVCAADEAMLAWRSGVDIDVTLSGSAVNTFGFNTSIQLPDVEAPLSVIVNDCDHWSDRSEFVSSTHFDNEGGVARSTSFAHTYMAFVFDETSGWFLKPAPLLNQTNCRSVQLLCCG